MDVFETLKSLVGCEYISDLRFEPYCSRAKVLMKRMILENCSLAELSDLACYIYGRSNFESKAAVIHFLQFEKTKE